MGAREVLYSLGLFAAAALAACGGDSGARHPEAGISGQRFEQINLDWRERRLARLTEPYGWLSLAGLVMLQPGPMTVGSTPDSDIVVSRGPDTWGTVSLDQTTGEVWFDVADEVDGVVVGDRDAAGSGGRQVLSDDPDGPGVVEAAGIRIHLVTPGGQPALRIRDPQAESRGEFVGLDYYPLDRDWRIDAEFVEHPEGTTMQVANVMGQLIEESNPGAVRFEHDGQVIELEAVLEDDELFFIFADRTSGRETYGLGRMLYAGLPRNGRVILDFNQAYNPPCVFNAYTTCPLPPPSNRIDAWIRAGEKKYAGRPGIRSPLPVESTGAAR